MRYRYGNTFCVSTQVGCAMGCAFVASTLDGKVRDLSAGEILGGFPRGVAASPTAPWAAAGR